MPASRHQNPKKKPEASQPPSDRSDTFVRDILQHMPHPFVAFDPENAITYVNPAFSKLVGFSSDEILGEKPPFIYWPEANQKQYFADQIGLNCNGGKVQQLIKKKDGSTFWVEIIFIPVKHEDQLKYCLGIWNDISERKQVEENLRRSEEKFSLIFNAIPIPLAINSFPDMKFLDVNTSFLQNGGLTRAEVIGQPILDLKWGMARRLKRPPMFSKKPAG